MTRLATPPPAVLFELEFGDCELVLRQHPDGMYSVTMVDDRVVVDEDQLQQIVGAFTQLGKEKGWL